MLLGLVGKPSVGKSTFFKAATLAEVEIASYPFTTIKANHGVGYVKVDCIDAEFKTQCNPNHGYCINHKRFVPIDLMDVAGLVPGASEGKGLGNQFLDDLRQADLFIQIVDLSGTTNEEGKPLKDGEEYDPSRDVKFLTDELDKWYYNILMKAWKTFVRKIEIEDMKFSEAVAKQFSGLKVDEEQVKSIVRKASFGSEKPTRWTESQVKEFASLLREESKPMIIAANKLDHENADKNLEKLKMSFPNAVIIPCSADSELALRQASKVGLIDYVPGSKNFSFKNSGATKSKALSTQGTDRQDLVGKKDFEIKKELTSKQEEALMKIKENVLDKYEFGTGVQEVLNRAVFDVLGYLAIFPASANKLGDSKGNILPDCFLLPGGSTALDFAYYLHTDFGKNFIKAINARTKQAVGKDYKLKNRDALEIITR